MSELPLKNYREVGSFDLLSPPLNPLGLIDGHTLELHMSELIQSGSRHIVLDASGLESLYSDTLTILAKSHSLLQGTTSDTTASDSIGSNSQCSLGIMTASQSITESIAKSELAYLVSIYPVETDLIQASMKMMAGQMPQVYSAVFSQSHPEASETLEDLTHEHDLNVVESEANQGFAPIIEEHNFHEVTSSPSEMSISNQVASDEDADLPQITRLDATSELSVLNVEEEAFNNPSDLSNQLGSSDQLSASSDDDLDQGSVKVKSSKKIVITTLFMVAAVVAILLAAGVIPLQ